MDLLLTRTEILTHLAGLPVRLWRGLTEDFEPAMVYVVRTVGADAGAGELLLSGPPVATLAHGQRCWVFHAETETFAPCLVYVARIELGVEVGRAARCLPPAGELWDRRQ
jgi:hypothetical protein